MKWNILINMTEGHSKFWSYSEQNDVAWGKIGTKGSSKQMPDKEIEKKLKDKVRKGYVMYQQYAQTHSPDLAEATEFWNGSRTMNVPKGNKPKCAYCGKGFNKNSKAFEYTDGSSYHQDCVKKINKETGYNQ